MNRTTRSKFIVLGIALVVLSIPLVIYAKKIGVVPSYRNAAKYNCKQSGGTFSNGKCSCGESVYERSTGYCITADGTPGGEFHKDAVKLQELKILKNTVVAFNCEQSGGSFVNEACSCPEEQGEKLEYKADTSYCTSSFGTPGGELGETARKLLELKMLKNE